VGCRARTILLVDLLLDVEVDARDDQVGDNVEGANGIQDIWVIERDLLGDLHKPPRQTLVHEYDSRTSTRGLQDDDKVGTTR
jgi:hypothetical protein